MKQKLTVVVLALLLITSFAFAQVQDQIERADELHEDEEYSEAIDLLEGTLSDARRGTERAEVLWRLSRASVGYGDSLEDQEASSDVLIEVFEQGEAWGQEAIEADSSIKEGYFWKASNIGRWGETRGILDSLFRAPDMRDLLEEAIEQDEEYADAYYVLGILYRSVPGVISFGNNDYAVSLGRLAVELHEDQRQAGQEEEYRYGYYIELAAHLQARNWNERRRNGQQDRKRSRADRASGVLEESFTYEGFVDIPDMSDAEEAAEILDEVISRLEGVSNRTDGEQRNLREARELRESL